MMCELTAEQQRQLEARMAADPGLAQGLAPLLAGRFGADARDLGAVLSVAAPGGRMVY